MTTTPGHAIHRHHHITLCTGGAQEDFDFHTKVLGLKIVKRTLLYDGQVPIYHFYYGNDNGNESTLVTSFPMRHTGRKARKGSGQIGSVSLSIPEGALDYWTARLTESGFETRYSERFGESQLEFQHPCGIDYRLVATKDDARTPHTKGPVPAEHMIRGTHAITVSVRDMDMMDEFMELGWGGTRVAADSEGVRYQIGAGGSGRYVDFVVEPNVKQGSWSLGEGFIHHMAFEVDTHEQQNAIKATLEALGFTDTSDVKNRGYFDSIYVRTPGGALFEATVSHQPSFACDEPADRIGHDVIVSPQFKQDLPGLIAQLGAIQD
ncbi:MAG: VOC family protein [Gammaproteobacteria bacterium]|nr:VOC family protein [Gammaproteobacteria bacterium]MBI5616589.1 VOC family protein [Gammaproteobacteria bacterium]